MKTNLHSISQRRKYIKTKYQTETKNTKFVQLFLICRFLRQGVKKLKE